MFPLKKFLLIFAVVILSFGISWADVYKWEDEDGVVHYSDTEPVIGSEWEEVDGATGTAETQQKNDQRPEFDREAITDLIKELEVAPGDDEEGPAPTVDLYVTSWCPYCHKAKSFFRSRGIEFAEYNVENDEEAAKRMSSLTKSRAVPFAVINGHHIQGFSVGAYEQALEN